MANSLLARSLDLTRRARTQSVGSVRFVVVDWVRLGFCSAACFVLHWQSFSSSRIGSNRIASHPIGCVATPLSLEPFPIHLRDELSADARLQTGCCLASPVRTQPLKSARVSHRLARVIVERLSWFFVRLARRWIDVGAFDGATSELVRDRSLVNERASERLDANPATHVSPALDWVVAKD